VAGIIGIIIKNDRKPTARHANAFASMLRRLSFSNDQKRASFSDKGFIFGNIVPVSQTINDHYYFSESRQIYCVIEGLIYVSDDERAKLKKRYRIDEFLSEIEIVTYLYDHYKSDFINHVTGWFNLFIYNKVKSEAFLVNDRLGYLPLYIYESESLYMFASKIECLLASGLLTGIDFDTTTLAEHLFFNYPISDFTYIKNIWTLPNATMVNFTQKVISSEKYWDISRLFGIDSVNNKESLSLINEGLHNALGKIILTNNQLNLSLTGGWDSRVVLSCLIPNYKEKLNLFSFGAPNSDDIIVPLHISEKEGLKYTPYILDGIYIMQSFLPQAIDTIVLSNGTRSYKRAHYLYAISQMSKYSHILITGIFGDEVFKFAQITSGNVLSGNTLDFLESDFNVNKTISNISHSLFFSYIDANKSELLSSIEHRLQSISEYMKQYENISQKYYAFRFEYNLRKYFGNETNSYNDFVYCFSPFIDYEFLKGFSRTRYFGTRYPFNSNRLSLKKQSARLYYELVKANYPALLNYYSSSGYSMKDVASITGQARILYKKYIKKRDEALNGFNTKPTNQIFIDNILTADKIAGNVFTQFVKAEMPGADKLNSLIYWVSRIAKSYL